MEEMVNRKGSGICLQDSRRANGQGKGAGRKAEGDMGRGSNEDTA